jgi:hypothetical protein
MNITCLYSLRISTPDIVNPKLFYVKRILLAIDATNPDPQAIDFACYIGRLTKSDITGFFLENLVANEEPSLKQTGGIPRMEWEVDEKGTDFQHKKSLTEKNIALFHNCCERKSVQSKSLVVSGIPAKELIAESRYADLIIIDAATSFNKLYEGTPTEFVRDTLKDAECPVIIAPDSFEGIDEIVFTYDGTKSSSFAIKQFTLLFPELREKKATVLHVTESGEWNSTDKQHFLDWVQPHYTMLGLKSMTGDAGYGLFDYLFKRKNTFIVMGAYGRSNLSRFFRHSQADLLINTMTQPIFISHY